MLKRFCGNGGTSRILLNSCGFFFAGYFIQSLLPSIKTARRNEAVGDLLWTWRRKTQCCQQICSRVSLSSHLHPHRNNTGDSGEDGSCLLGLSVFKLAMFFIPKGRTKKYNLKSNFRSILTSGKFLMFCVPRMRRVDTERITGDDSELYRIGFVAVSAAHGGPSGWRVGDSRRRFESVGPWSP